jgi:FkbH-like protein
MRVELKPFDELDLPRIAQLINKTNQFNLTTRRLSESQVRALINRPGCYTQSMRLRDRFGDNGLTGVLIAYEEGDSLRIDNWLMSCRVLGRRVEEVMLGALMRYASTHGFRHVLGEYVPTSKNEQVRELFDQLGFERIEEQPSGARKYRWNPSKKTLKWTNCFQVDDQTQ